MSTIYTPTDMRRRINLTLEPKVITRLQALAKENNRSKSRMIEILIMEAYENKQRTTTRIKEQTIREKVDDLDFTPK